MNKKTKSLGAVLAGLAGVGALALSASNVEAASRLCDSVNWNTSSQCIGGGGSVWAAASGRGEGSGSSAKIGVSIDQGDYARAWTWDANGSFIAGCSALDTTVNGDSSYDLTGCGNAASYRLKVYW